MSSLPALAGAAAAAAGRAPAALEAPLSRARRLRQAIESRRLAFLMEAHNGLSAKIVEEAGFGGVWASGLTISASLGLRDSNEASWTQVLEVPCCSATTSSKA